MACECSYYRLLHVKSTFYLGGRIVLHRAGGTNITIMIVLCDFNE